MSFDRCFYIFVGCASVRCCGGCCFLFQPFSERTDQNYINIKYHTEYFVPEQTMRKYFNVTKWIKTEKSVIRRKSWYLFSFLFRFNHFYGLVQQKRFGHRHCISLIYFRCLFGNIQIHKSGVERMKKMKNKIKMKTLNVLLISF